MIFKNLHLIFLTCFIMNIKAFEEFKTNTNLHVDPQAEFFSSNENNLNFLCNKLKIFKKDIDSSINMLRLSKDLWIKNLEIKQISRQDKYYFEELISNNNNQNLLNQSHKFLELNFSKDRESIVIETIDFIPEIQGFLLKINNQKTTINGSLKTLTYYAIALGKLPESYWNLNESQVKLIKELNKTDGKIILTYSHLAQLLNIHTKELVKLLKSFDKFAQDQIINVFALQDDTQSCCVII